MPKFKHVEIVGVDGAKLRSFYAALFGWRISSRKVGDFDYFDIHVNGEPSAGIRQEPEGSPEIVVYVEVPDLKQSVQKAGTLGAKVRVPPMRYGDLHFAVIEDPEGNPIGLIEEESREGNGD